MCIFNTAVKRVQATKILVSQTYDGRQLTVYQNYVVGTGTRQDAMILPFPILDKRDAKIPVL